MDPSNLLPIRPTSPTLQSHLSALDKTIAQLDQLPSRTRWPAYIPLTSRARIQGQIIHPNEVKVDLGDGWWVEMTADEAGGYLKRRKIALLEAQAKLLEGGGGQSTSRIEISGQLPPPVRLNTVFMGIDSVIPSSSSSKPKASSSTPSTSNPISAKPSRNVIPPSPASIPSSSAPTATTDQPDSLQAILEKFVSNEKSLMEASHSGGEEVMTNEEGLPIRDICETPDGELIGPPPESDIGDEDAVSTVEVDALLEEDYDVGIARRRALHERTFGKDDDTPSEEEEESLDLEEEKGEEKEEQRSESPIEDEHLPAPISSRPPSTQSTPAPIPRGILKPPPTQVRKKSVSFDPTVPIPPDSPDTDPSGTKKMGFDIALTAPGIDESEFGVRPVPVIAIPVPGKKASGGFGGMKRGFLDPSSGSTSRVVEKKEDKEVVGGKKKPSLFAQRMASSVVKESPMPKASSSNRSDEAGLSAPSGSGSGLRIPSLPIMSNSATSATNTLRSSVIEKQSIPSTSTQSSSSSKFPPPSSSKSGIPGEEVGLIDDDDYDSDLDEEEDEEEEEEEEDEYDLDDALLAREVALEYHRRRAYSSPYISQDPDDPGYGYLPSEPSDSGGVMLAIPSIDNTGGGAPTIINPTPDDFRRFVRVGKLENGNLVLAPGEEGWSDDEDDEDGELEMERRKKRDNRQKVREALLGHGSMGEGEEEKGVSRGRGTIGNVMPGVSDPGKSKEAISASRGEAELPPTVVAAPRETIAPAVGAVKERRVDAEQGKESVVEQPKKVSRFKAARMGGM